MQLSTVRLGLSTIASSLWWARGRNLVPVLHVNIHAHLMKDVLFYSFERLECNVVYSTYSD